MTADPVIRLYEPGDEAAINDGFNAYSAGNEA